MSTATKKQAIAALAVLTAYVNADAAAAAEAETTEANIPTSEEFAAYDKAAVKALAEKFGVTSDKFSALKSLVGTLVSVANDEEVEVDALNAAAEAIGVTPDKKAAKTTAALKKWLSSLAEESESEESEETEEASEEEEAEEAEESEEDSEEETAEEEESDDDSDTEEETEEASDDDDAETEDSDADAEESEDDSEDEAEGDDVDRAAIARKFKDFPEEEDMQERVDAYEEAADKKLAGKLLKDKYRSLVAELVATDETVSDWGVAYARDGQGFCCGLPLEDHEVEGVDQPTGKCAITGKVFVLNEDGDGFNEHVAKKKIVAKKK